MILSLIAATAAGIFVIHGSSAQESSAAPTPAHAAPAVPTKQPAERPSPAPAPVIPDYQIPPIVDGLAPVLSTIPTQQKVVFLGIDDGQHREPSQLKLMKKHHIKASLFLAETFIADDPAFFKDFIAAGSIVENHSLNHNTEMSELTYEQQVHEICSEADLQEQQFGRRPVLFRPPGGNYNQDTQRAAADCGMKALILWIAKANGGSMQYQVGDSLQPGDIVLMHFRPEFADDMAAFIEAQQAAGLHTELLEDWLPAGSE